MPNKHVCRDPTGCVVDVCMGLYVLVIPLKIKYNFKGDHAVQGAVEPAHENISKEVYLAVAQPSKDKWYQL